MPTTLWRITERSTFGELRRRGRRSRSGPITVTWLPGPGDTPPRVGYVVGRVVGNAVARNRVKRRLRAIMADLAPELAPGTYLVAAAPAVTRMDFHEMRSSTASAIAALGPASRGASASGGSQ